MKKSNSLTPKQFEYIVTQCDAVLAEHRAVFPIVGIAWLNVLHSHPSIQERYIHVFHKRSIAQLTGVIIKGTGIILKDLFLSFLGVFKKNKKWKTLPTQTDVFFISHLLNAQTPKNAPDFYFQDLPEYLQERGYHTAVGLMNHVKGFTDWDADREQHGRVEKFILPDSLDFRNELLLVGRSLQSAIFFFKQYLKEKEPLKKSFLFELVGNTLSPHTFRAYRLYETTSNIIKNTNTKVVALTWEGHSWEKMVCHAAKTAGRKICTIGYQHTVLYPSSHALKQSVGAAYDPDIILTVGTITRDILKESFGLEKVCIHTYGSPRLQVAHAGRIQKQIQRGCLVAPDGLVNECILLFSFAIDAATQMPGTDFIFRTHPAINFSDLQTKDSRLRDLPSNVILSSNKNINDDFNRCSWLLYRVSSVSFFAVLEGLRPIYLLIENEIVNDVLYKLNSWRKQVGNVNELKEIINADKHSADDERHKESEEAYRFCRAYMMPYDKQVFEQSISGEMMNA